MTVHPAPQAAPDSAQAGQRTAYDSTWAGSEASTELPTQQPDAFERVMLSHDKIYVVLAVVLLVWLGLVLLLFRTDRRLRRLERTLEAEGLEEKV